MGKNETISRQFKRKRNIHDAILAIMFAALFCALWLSNNRDYFKSESARRAVMASICAVSISGLLLYYLNWRCPSCRRSLGRQRNPRKCPRCGAQLQ